MDVFRSSVERKNGVRVVSICYHCNFWEFLLTGAEMVVHDYTETGKGWVDENEHLVEPGTSEWRAIHAAIEADRIPVLSEIVAR